MSEQHELLALLINHIDKLISGPVTPDLPDLLQNKADIVSIHEKMDELRKILNDFAKGVLAHDIRMRGYMAGSLKALQSHLRHLTWQVQQVEHGDFTQRVHFLGDFSEAFNNMVMQLDNTMKALRLKEEALTNLAETLQKEVELRTAAVYALKQSEAKFKYLAEHDPLTGILNRRSFHNLAVSELQSAGLAGMFCCIALLDVDHFKKFNDTYGHLEGDIALRHVVQVAQEHLRQCDILGRFGGEEFIFFFGGVDGDQGKTVAERIRQAIEFSPVPLSDGRKIPITVSIGVASSPPEWYSPKTCKLLFQYLTSRADAALYDAKSKSRNAVLVADLIKPEFEHPDPEFIKNDNGHEAIKAN